MSYQQFCPISKAMEVLGEKWTLLVIRELLMGSTRFGELQKGLTQMSPTLLSKRLAFLEQEHLIIKRKIHGQKGYEYFPTASCQELMPILESIGVWGMRWARQKMQENDFDVQLLMLYLERSIQTEQLLGRETIIRFNFTDVLEYPTWWIVVEGDALEVCVRDPGKEVDVHLTVKLKTMCQLWMGELSYKRALLDKQLLLVGPPALTRSIDKWIKSSVLAGIAPAEQIIQPV